jgi:hypothetical protein
MPANPEPSSQPSAGRVVRLLKDGYWDRTEVIELADGSRRVRKRNKAAATGPWGVESLRREIRYLTTVPVRAAAVLPRVFACWDRETAGAPDIGYEMPFYGHHTDAGELARRRALGQAEIDDFQRELADAVLDRLHEPAPRAEPLSRHLVPAIRQALDGLEAEPALARLINADAIELNGGPAVGTRAALERIIRETEALAALDRVPAVRIHGDFFLENILWRPAEARPPSGLSGIVPPGGTTAEAWAKEGNEPRLILVDPVSVAGVSEALPLFDLVKYESYATGELVALRSERVEVAGIGSGGPRYRWGIRWNDTALQPYREFDWQRGFRRAYETKYGPVDRRLYRLIDGYFSAAMALNTGGLQRPARLLKATADLNAVLAGG